MKISSVAAPINNNSNYNINDNNNKCDLYRAFHDPQRHLNKNKNLLLVEKW